jgi:hypothetical protein
MSRCARALKNGLSSPRRELSYCRGEGFSEGRWSKVQDEHTEGAKHNSDHGREEWVGKDDRQAYDARRRAEVHLYADNHQCPIDDIPSETLTRRNHCWSHLMHTKSVIVPTARPPSTSAYDASRQPYITGMLKSNIVGTGGFAEMKVAVVLRIKPACRSQSGRPLNEMARVVVPNIPRQCNKGNKDTTEHLRVWAQGGKNTWVGKRKVQRDAQGCISCSIGRTTAWSNLLQSAHPYAQAPISSVGPFLHTQGGTRK